MEGGGERGKGKEWERDKPFLIPIEHTCSISGRGTVVTGQVERGTIKKGSEIEIIGYKSKLKTTVTGQSLIIDINSYICLFVSKFGDRLKSRY